METALVKAGKVLLQKGGEPEYAVEMVSDSDLSLLQTAMIRYADNAEMTEQQSLRDRELEEAWCDDHRYIRQKLAERGFAAEFKLQIPAGEHPIKVVLSEEPRSRKQAGQRGKQRAISKSFLTRNERVDSSSV
jgi:hypothetical protein